MSSLPSMQDLPSDTHDKGAGRNVIKGVVSEQYRQQQELDVYQRYREQRIPGLDQYSSVGRNFDDVMTESDQKTTAYAVMGTTRAIAMGVGRATVCKLLGHLSAGADVLALSTVEINIGNIQPGVCTTFKWRGKPVFVKHRTEHEIAAAKEDDNADLRDRQSDASRVKNEKYLIVIGICTHLGCVPLVNTGDYAGGFFCPCHGSHYDVSGRIRKGPAPLNLEVPEYKFLSDDVVLLG